MANKTTYTVEWSRPLAEDGTSQDRQVCTNLTERDLVRRLVGAVKMNGTISVHAVTRETSKPE